MNTQARQRKQATNNTKVDGQCCVEKCCEVEETKGSRLGHFTSLLVIDVAAHTTSVDTFGPEQNSIAWFVAVGLAVMLCVAASRQSLAAPLTAQAGSMPVFAQ